MLPLRQRPTGVACPACTGTDLIVCFSCRQTSFYCRHCGREFDLGELHRALTGEAFDRLARLVEERVSDRV